MADSPKPPPLLTRPGWELATPAAASTMATSGALFGVPGIIGAGVAAAGAAGIAAARNRPKRPARAAKVKTPRQQRRATAARAGMGAAPMGGALSKLRGLAGVPRPAAGRGAGNGAGGSSRGAGSGARGASGSGLGGKPVGPLGRALGGLRGGATGGPAGKRSASSGASAPAGGKGAGPGLGVPRPKPFRLGGSSTSRKPATGATSSGAGAGRGMSSGTKGGAVKRALGKLGGSGRRGGSAGSSGGARGRGSGSGSPRSPGRSALGRLLGRGKSSGSTGSSGSGRKGGGSAGGGGSSGKTSPLRRGLQRLTGRAPKKVSLRKKRKAPRWVGRILGRKKKPAPKTEPAKPGSPVAKTAIDQALAGDKKTRRRATPSTSTAPVTPSRAARTGSPTSSSTPTAGGSMAPNPYAAVIEACGIAAQGYSPDNALRVIEWYEAMPDLIDAIAGMLDAQGAKTTEEFYLYPEAGKFAQALGRQFLRYKDPCAAARTAFERAHAEDIERVKNPQRNQEKWDIEANRE